MEMSFQNFSVYFIWSFYEKIMVSKVKMCIAAIEFWSLNFNTLYIILLNLL